MNPIVILLEFCIAFAVTYTFVLVTMGQVINRRVLLRWNGASLNDKLNILMFWHVLLISVMSVLIHQILLYAGI